MASSLIDLLEASKGERIFDLGCGTGELTAQLHKLAGEVIGLDCSSEMLEQARRAYPHIQFDQADTHGFHYEQPFDAVFSNAAFHWLTEPSRAVSCVTKCLKPGGRFVLEFGSKGNVAVVTRAASFAAAQTIGQSIHHPWYFPSISEFSSLLEASGFEVNQAYLFDRPTVLDGDEGLRDWLRMFGSHWLEQIPDEQHDAFFKHAESDDQGDLFRDGDWHADYRRIRIVARRNLLIVESVAAASSISSRAFDISAKPSVRTCGTIRFLTTLFDAVFTSSLEFTVIVISSNDM